MSTISISTRTRGSVADFPGASASGSKDRIWNRRTPVTAVSIAITDW
ncbi:hypothetical protein [Mycobacterium sp.]|nr:hypothetical protein [Mycobacterium sp.]HTH90906.1 hypothetical protein [Mycobacterium sp.]